MVCLGTPQTSRLQILWWWYSILTVYNKESWLIIGIEILSPIKILLSIAVTVFYFTHFSCKGLDCFVFSSVCDFYYFKKGFQWDHRKECIDCSVPRQKAIHAEEYQYSENTGREKWKREDCMRGSSVAVWLGLQAVPSSLSISLCPQSYSICQ